MPSPIITFDAVMREPLPPIDWLVEGVLGSGDRAVVYAEYGARRRIHRLGLSLGDVGAIPFAALSHHGVRINDDGARRLLRHLKAWQWVPDLLIIDALRRVLVGDESMARDVSEFWRALDVMRDTGMTIVLAHHMKKKSRTGNEARQRFSGSTDILAGADTAYAVHRVPPDGVTVECVKARSIAEPPPFGVRIADDGPDSTVRLLYVPAPDKAAKLGRAERMALAYMATQTLPVKTGDVIRHLHAGSVAVRTAERALPRLKALGCVRNPERGVWELVEVGNALV